MPLPPFKGKYVRTTGPCMLLSLHQLYTLLGQGTVLVCCPWHAHSRKCLLHHNQHQLQGLQCSMHKCIQGLLLRASPFGSKSRFASNAHDTVKAPFNQACLNVMQVLYATGKILIDRGSNFALGAH